jgi:hypothetical protein
MTLGEVKRFLNKKITYDGDPYMFQGCLLFLDEVHGEYRYSAKITSIKTRCVMWVPLEKIKGD